jgi:fructuronate reductase
VRLSAATADSLPDWVEKPTFTRTPAHRRIVHLGIGAFHRAHQAVYTDDAQPGADRDWGITGVSLRSPAVHDSLESQDQLYTVLTKGGAGGLRLIGSLERVLVAPRDPAAVISAIADPATEIVTLTVTEKGYFRAPGTGGLDLAAGPVAADLRGEPPQTIYGYIAAALERRRAVGGGGLSLVSCDNLPSNGTVLHGLLNAFLELRDPSLRDWAEANIACPETMVDRIVPATTAQDIDRVEALTGFRDEALVVAEPFRQWVIQDRFAGPRPAWEAGGAQLVSNVAPFELAKLRLLNGSHSTLAYVGLALGHQHVHEAIADEDLKALVRTQMNDEAAPSMPQNTGLDVDSYSAAILERFANPDLPHRLAQIAMDGSQKIPQRWLATIAERAGRDSECRHHLLSLAAWIAYTRGRTADGAAYIVDDPLSDRFAEAWSGSSDIEQIVAAMIGAGGIVPVTAPADVVPLVADVLRAWLNEGARSTLRRHLSGSRADA